MTIPEIGQGVQISYYTIFKLLAESQGLAKPLFPQLLALFQVGMGAQVKPQAGTTHQYTPATLSLQKTTGEGSGAIPKRPLELLFPLLLRQPILASHLSSKEAFFVNTQPLNSFTNLSKFFILNPIALLKIDFPIATPQVNHVMHQPPLTFPLETIKEILLSVKGQQTFSTTVHPISVEATAEALHTVSLTAKTQEVKRPEELSLTIILKEIAKIDSHFVGSTQALHTLLQPPHPPLPLNIIVPYPFEMNIKAAPLGGTEHSKKRGDKPKEQGNEKDSQLLVLIPLGPLFTDEKEVEIASFGIAVTPVTNSQFAHWLTECYERKEIVLSEGSVYDLEGQLICHTYEKVSTSQIHLKTQEGKGTFKPLKNTDFHPVVHITFWGASLFCQTQGFRLPTEQEWERAASMTPSLPGERPKQFLFGCSKDTMTIACANYRESFAMARPLENRTTPVGFYNGESLFAKLYQTVRTENGASPFGCYDMSGNVREWVKEGVTKGGSYDCPLEELKIAARTQLHLKSADALTGFRVALTL